MDYIYDTEVYPNCFLLCMMDAEGIALPTIGFVGGHDNSASLQLLRNRMTNLQQSNARMVGFNNIGFDYPVLHFILQSGICDPAEIYKYAKAVIEAENKFMFMVKPSDCWVPQIDLFKIHHFDNKARMTSLKALEFNMRMDNISDLPFPVGSVLSQEQIRELVRYCQHDVEATLKFYRASIEKIEFREKLCQQYPDRNWLAFSDVKIGKEFFQRRLEAAGVQCYTYGPDGRLPRQTRRSSIHLGDCVPACVRGLTHPEFKRVHGYFTQTVVTQTKDAFKLTAEVNGLEYVFGTGGIHASVEAKSFEENEHYTILDVDVTSLYPSIAIEHNIYPEHLGPKFVEVYRDLRTERLKHPKGSAENAMLKLALNGVYGVSNDPFSVFFDPLFTMKITVGGQLMIAMLIDRLTGIHGVDVIQANTDGITLYLPRILERSVRMCCKQWEQDTKLSLEYVGYRKMFIADVNNYIAQTVDGKIKRKGRYDYEAEWHQNASKLVVPKVAEQVLIHNKPIRQTVEEWQDLHDFMLRVKAPKGSRFVMETGWGDLPITDRTVRYYVATEGANMVKIMPPLAKRPGVERRIGVESGWKVRTCNNIAEAIVPINHNYYIAEVEKLVLGVL